MRLPFLRCRSIRTGGGGGGPESGRKNFFKKCLPAGTGTKIYFSRMGKYNPRSPNGMWSVLQSTLKSISTSTVWKLVAHVPFISKSLRKECRNYLRTLCLTLRHEFETIMYCNDAVILWRANRWTAQKKGMPTKCPKNIEKCPKNDQNLSTGTETTIFGHLMTFFDYLVDTFVWWPCPMLARYNCTSSESNLVM